MAKQDKKAAEETTEIVAPVNGTAALAKSFDYGDDAGQGFDSGDRLKIPFLSLLQSNSRVVEKKEIEGLEAGMFFNSVTKEAVPGATGVGFIPVHTSHCYVEWSGEAGSGIPVAKHALNSAEVDEAKDAHFKATGLKFPDKKHPLKLGENDLIETYYVYGFLLDEAGEEGVGIAVFSFTSSKIKDYENWISALRLLRVKNKVGKLINPPLIANRCKIFSRDDTQKGTGKPFKNVRLAPFSVNKIDSLLDHDNPKHAALYAEAKQYAEDIKSGALKEDFANQGGVEDVAGEAAEDKPAF